MKRFVIIVINLLICTYIVLVFTAFKKADRGEQQICQGVRVNILEGITEGFLSDNDVKQLLADENVDPTGQDMHSINTRVIEDKLRAKEFIGNIEAYKSQDNYINIVIRQRFPVMHVMADNGKNYYVDEIGKILDNTDYACDLIIATGAISKSYARRVLAPIGKLLIDDVFWYNQVVQINVLPDSTVEMVPRVGDHILYFGRPVNMKRKLDRLRKFYLYGLSQAGWNKYSRISAEFDNQIICKRNQ